MTDELKPVKCGCGGEAYARAYVNTFHVTEDGYDHTVYCNKCNIETKMYDTETEAVEAWNKAMGADQFRESTKKIERTAKAKVNFKDENYYFGWCECGQYQSSRFPYCPACGCRLIWGDER